MKSIRLSLIVYVLVLVALVLGGVSTLVYQTVLTTLEEKQANTEKLLETQFWQRADAARIALDTRLLRQARLLANNARRVSLPTHDKLFAVEAIAAGTSASGRFLIPMWTVWNSNTHYAQETSRQLLFGYDITITDAEGLMPLDDDHPQQEFFQTYRRTGTTLQRSQSLGDNTFTLIAAMRELPYDAEEFDDLEIGGVRLRRVTLKRSVTTSRIVPVAPRPGTFPPFQGSKGKGQSKGQPPRTPPDRFTKPFDQSAPVVFVQYAADTGHLDQQVHAFQVERMRRLTDTRLESQAALAHLQRQFFWYGALSFAAVIIGGYLLVRLGLAPLARLSDAVSKVSEKNFKLQLNTQRLPNELRPIADRLRQSLDQLQRAFAYEKQASADISHELRTPLAALMTTLDVALRKKRSPEEYHDILEECRASGRHMSYLVERLMALARLDAGVERLTLEPVDVADLGQQCADMVRSLAEEQGLELHVRIAEPIITRTDAGKLREIMLNLLHNAIAYNKPHGSIDLSVQRTNGSVEVEVSDTGIGISPEARPHLFERFFRADPSRHADEPHCGLGLAIVKSYIDLLGGSIHVDSSSAGSTFRVRLPLDRDVASPTPTDAAMQTAASL